MIGAVLLVTGIAYSVSRFVEVDSPGLPLREVFIGSWGVLVSDARPPERLLFLALIGIALIAVTAVCFEIIASLMAISPRTDKMPS